MCVGPIPVTYTHNVCIGRCKSYYIHLTHTTKYWSVSVYPHVGLGSAVCQFEYNHILHIENLGTEEELFIEVLEHKHAEEHRDIFVQELGAAHIVTAIVVIETTWVNLEARSTHSEAHSWNCFMFMLGVERNLPR